ncbi:MAG: ribosome-associated translation inhibitor RaiA [Ignavibacteriae bacterium]|nr:ribosome-associated translation inhibitor RaiA [Ignavibacteriota bacterium]MCB9216614.1 ribosome-associated translation inhibitor RaiA [Ignavibacteria bacterium]
MDVQITARHFKARPELVEFAEEAVGRLSNIYDGIVNAKIILEIEAHNEGKIAEIILLVYHDQLFAKESGDDFEKCISTCIDKLERQLQKYKEKHHNVRGAREPNEVVLPDEEEL